MRALRQIREDKLELANSFEGLLDQFPAATIDLNRALSRTEVARILTERSAEIFRTTGAALALDGGDNWQIVALAGYIRRSNQITKEKLAEVLRHEASRLSDDPQPHDGSIFLGPDLAAVLNWKTVVLLRLMGRGGNVLGVLALGDPRHELSCSEVQVLNALASHASAVLENIGLLSRIEQSRKHWVQDFDAITDFIIVHDASGCVIRVNQALANLLGLQVTDAIGWHVTRLKLFSQSLDACHCPLCRDGNSCQQEFLYQRAERTYLVSTSCVESPEQPEKRTVHVLKDITERREAERRYQRERDFNKNILNNTQSMILVLDTAGLISYANRRCSDAGYGEDKLLGRAFADLVPLQNKQVFVQALHKTLEGIPVENLEGPLIRADGSTGQFSISLSPMRDEQGEINSVVIVMADITESINLQAKLMHTEKLAALGQLVSGVAHEVNNPLAAIVGFTDLLLENPDLPETAKSDLQVILQEAQRTRVIVQNLLSFARQMPAQREPVQVNTLLRQTVKLRSYDVSNHDVQVSESYDTNLPLTIGDPNQLQQVFLNILNNAYDAIREGHGTGKIHIATSHRENELDICFWNNGPAISEIDRIFDPFFTTKDVGKGTGLGLSICYGIIRAHGGEIMAQNDSDGNGCAFFVRLPVACVQAPVVSISKND